MRCRFLKLERKQTRKRSTRLAYASLTALVAVLAAVSCADARSGRTETPVESIQSRASGLPIMAIVSLRNQRITIYDKDGWILRAPISSGQSGRETPAGIFSVIQKEAEHYSNLYDDASMPNMQRITWSGIALHGGPLPGYPASHGCVRMPYDFAERLFGATQLGMRVIVAPGDVAPVDIAHSILFRPKPGAGALATARTAEATEATRKADEARRAAWAALREVTRTTAAARVAENLKRRAEAQLPAIEATLGAATSDEAKAQAEDAKAKAVAGIAGLETQLASAKADLQPRLDALTAARGAADAAEAARVVAAEAARRATRELEPVSVLISRKTQRLYVRQSFEPILESPVTIQDADRPIGTHVFTAMERTGSEAELRWSVISLDGGHPNGGTDEAHVRAPRTSERDAGPISAADGAKAALDRIVIPQDVLDRIPGITPRSSLIVTDEALSSETAKGTDFVILLSGEPQGGVKFRRHTSGVDFGSYARPRGFSPYWRSPVAGPSW
jgi:hypothetical protein